MTKKELESENRCIKELLISEGIKSCFTCEYGNLDDKRCLNCVDYMYYQQAKTFDKKEWIA